MKSADSEFKSSPALTSWIVSGSLWFNSSVALAHKQISMVSKETEALSRWESEKKFGAYQTSL